jgi:hypothetical protein
MERIMPARMAVCLLVGLVTWFPGSGGTAYAQTAPASEPPAPPSLPSTETAQGAFTGGNSSVGYIDSALPLSLFRFRYDAAYDNNRPTRAEFFYAQGAPGGPGTPKPETRIDYQDVSAYLELAPSSCFSAFVELPVRFLNPEINRDAAGLTDLNAGFKYAFWRDEALTATFQFRTYAPTGDPGLGLGNGHVSLEPALLIYMPLAERLTFEGELRYWTPIGGTDFAGDVIRYGAGLSYTVFESCNLRLTPVAEFVGWTVLGGKETVLPPSGIPLVEDAAGDTIVNVKLGVRARFQDRGDLYIGYGRPLTGDQWYENILRLEFRLFF